MDGPQAEQRILKENGNKNVSYTQNQKEAAVIYWS